MLYEFIANSQIHHSEKTMYKEIFSFPAASSAQISSHDVSVNAIQHGAKRYWHLNMKNRDASYQQAAHELRDLLYSSVQFRLRADVPVGSALSGGIDSSTIVSILSKLNPLEQKTFSASFPGTNVDERRFAELVVKGTKIRPTFIEPTHESLAQEFEKLIWHQDGPVVSTSMFAQWKVFEAARMGGIPVMLDGQGADELFAGYEGYWSSMTRSLFQTSTMLEAVKLTAKFMKNHPKYFLNTKRLHSKKQRLFDWLGIFNPSLQEEILSQDGESLEDPVTRVVFKDPLKQALSDATFKSSLPALLTYEDRNSMAFSIESRTPFLDYRIVEYAFSLPTSYLIKNGVRKSILREAVKDLIPEKIRTRNDKIGFATPESLWSKKVYPKLFEKYSKETANRLFDAKKMKAAYQSSRSFRIIAALCAEKVMGI